MSTTSDMFDEYFERLREEADEHFDEEGRIRCMFCGEGDMQWDRNHHDATGKWRLWEGEWPDGKAHHCPKLFPRVQAALDFEAIPQEPLNFEALSFDKPEET